MALTKKTIQHLRPDTRRWIKRIEGKYFLEEHHELLLVKAGETYDRILEAREAVAANGAYFLDRFGCPRPHPGLAVERDNRIQLVRILRELCLDTEVPEDSRPPRTRG